MLFGSIGFWRWCIAIWIIEFLDFVRRPVRVSCPTPEEGNRISFRNFMFKKNTRRWKKSKNSIIQSMSCVAEGVCTENETVFENIWLSIRTTVDRVKEMNSYLLTQLRDAVQMFARSSTDLMTTLTQVAQLNCLYLYEVRMKRLTSSLIFFTWTQLKTSELLRTFMQECQQLLNDISSGKSETSWPQIDHRI
jgi:hypothetical protein